MDLAAATTWKQQQQRLNLHDDDDGDLHDDDLGDLNNDDGFFDDDHDNDCNSRDRSLWFGKLRFP